MSLRTCRGELSDQTRGAGLELVEDRAAVETKGLTDAGRNYTWQKPAMAPSICQSHTSKRRNMQLIHASLMKTNHVLTWTGGGSSHHNRWPDLYHSPAVIRSTRSSKQLHMAECRRWGQSYKTGLRQLHWILQPQGVTSGRPRDAKGLMGGNRARAEKERIVKEPQFVLKVGWNICLLMLLLTRHESHINI